MPLPKHSLLKGEKGELKQHWQNNYTKTRDTKLKPTIFSYIYKKKKKKKKTQDKQLNKTYKDRAMMLPEQQGQEIKIILKREKQEVSNQQGVYFLKFWFCTICCLMIFIWQISQIFFELNYFFLFDFCFVLCFVLSFLFCFVSCLFGFTLDARLAL